MIGSFRLAHLRRRGARAKRQAGQRRQADDQVLLWPAGRALYPDCAQLHGRGVHLNQANRHDGDAAKPDPDGRRLGSLTLGRPYEVLGIECDGYRLLNDCGEPCLFEPECFEVTDPHEPAVWISELGDERERYAYPFGWGVPCSFEAWHDGVDLIRGVFAEQLRAWYPAVASER